jgi:hypothetical protein
MLVVPAGHWRSGDAAAVQSQHRLVPKRSEDWWRTRVRGLSRSVWSMKVNAIRHEQDRGCVLPDRFKPRRLGARVEQTDAVAVLGELADPGAHHVAIERWI